MQAELVNSFEPDAPATTSSQSGRGGASRARALCVTQEDCVGHRWWSVSNSFEFVVTAISSSGFMNCFPLRVHLVEIAILW